MKKLPVHYFCSEGTRDVIESFAKVRHERVGHRVQVQTYESLLTSNEINLPLGHVIFADLERLTAPQIELSARIWRALDEASYPVRVLSHPGAAKRRYELLRTLHDSGVNPFNVYRATENRLPRTYPVFLRNTHDHNGPLSGLITSEQELNDALEACTARGMNRDAVLIVEFCDTADANGIYRKYSVLRVGDQLLGWQMQFDETWMVKRSAIINEDTAAEELAHAQEPQFADQLFAVFELAGIEYGRMDYAVKGNGICVWEINTHPVLYVAGVSDNPLRAESKRIIFDRFDEAFDTTFPEFGPDFSTP